MSDFKFKIPIYEIVDETGALKFLFFYETNTIPIHGNKIVTLVELDEDTRKMFYYQVTSILRCTLMMDNSIIDCEKEPVVIYVKKILEENVK